MTATTKQILENAKNIHLALHSELAHQRQKFDEWIELQHLTLEKALSEHKANMKKGQEEITALKLKEKSLRLDQQKYTKEREQRRIELETAEKNLDLLKEKENIVPKSLEALRQTIARETQLYHQTKQDVEAAEKERKYKQMELAKGASLYRDRLGLRFERFEGSENRLRFVFTMIDPKDPLREFYFSITVEDNIYKVFECQPPLPVLPALLCELNRTNDMHKFVTSIRKAFRMTVAH